MSAPPKVGVNGNCLCPSVVSLIPGTTEAWHFCHAEEQVARGGGAYGQKIHLVEYTESPVLEEAYYRRRMR